MAWFLYDRALRHESVKFRKRHLLGLQFLDGASSRHNFLSGLK